MPETQPRIYKFLLMFLPVGVVIGTIVFMVMYFYMEREEKRDHAVIASYGLRLGDLEDMVGKFTDRIGLRDHATPEGRRGLKRAASMIEGRLGPQNVGYPVEKGPGMAIDGLLWKSLWVDLRGENNPDEVVLAAVSYAGAGELADAHCVSTLVMLASSMAREKPAKTIRFVFLPLNQTPEEQNRWLLDRCIGSGETCAGIVSLKTMTARPEAGGGEWEVVAPREIDQRWWKYVSQSGPTPEPASSPSASPTVWVSASVFSSQAWEGRKEGQLQQTLEVARKVEKWLRRAAR